MKTKNSFFLLVLIIIGVQCTQTAEFAEKRTVIIYNGKGVSQTEDGYLGNAYCWENIAKKAGYKTIIVTEVDSQKITEYFSKEAIWVQPGGDANEVVDNMPKTMVNNIIDFVGKGGGFVTGCAGAFLAGEYFSYRDTTGELITYKGWGFIPDTVFVDQNYQDTSQYGLYNVYLSTNWQIAGNLDIYWWFGAVFSNKNLGNDRTNIISTYRVNNMDRILTITSFYKKGPLFLCGAHPEADISWYRDFINPPNKAINIEPTHGAATEMLLWAFLNNAYTP